MLARVFEALIAKIDANKPIDGLNTRVSDAAGGRSINASAPSPAGGAAGGGHPFKVVDASTTGPDVAKVRIYSGMINALDPVTVGPFDTADDPPFILTVSNNHRVYLDLTVAYNATTGVWSCTAYTVANAASTPASTSTHAYHLLVTVTVASDAVTGIGGGVNGNIGWRRCGGSGSTNDQWWNGG